MYAESWWLTVNSYSTPKDTTKLTVIILPLPVIGSGRDMLLILANEGCLAAGDFWERSLFILEEVAGSASCTLGSGRVGCDLWNCWWQPTTMRGVTLKMKSLAEERDRRKGPECLQWDSTSVKQYIPLLFKLVWIKEFCFFQPKMSIKMYKEL